MRLTGSRRRRARRGSTATCSRCGGPREGFAGASSAGFAPRRGDVLSADTAASRPQAGVTVAPVSVGDAGTRWGSCSASGAIRYNWRLVLAPPESAAGWSRTRSRTACT